MRRASLLPVTAVAMLSASSGHATVLISSDKGGLIKDYAARFITGEFSGPSPVAGVLYIDDAL